LIAFVSSRRRAAVRGQRLDKEGVHGISELIPGNQCTHFYVFYQDNWRWWPYSGVTLVKTAWVPGYAHPVLLRSLKLQGSGPPWRPGTAPPPPLHRPLEGHFICFLRKSIFVSVFPLYGAREPSLLQSHLWVYLGSLREILLLRGIGAPPGRWLARVRRDWTSLIIVLQGEGQTKPCSGMEKSNISVTNSGSRRILSALPSGGAIFFNTRYNGKLYVEISWNEVRLG